jgi:hypothetical protein
MSNNQPPNREKNHKKALLTEWILSIIAAFNCFFVVVLFTSFTSQNLIQGFSSLWPFPLIYFIEIMSIGVIGIAAMFRLQRQEKSNWSAVFWVCSGLLLSFVILGAWTIGFYLIPAMVVYLVLGIISDKRIGNDIPRHVVFFVAAGFIQATFVLLTLIG